MRSSWDLIPEIAVEHYSCPRCAAPTGGRCVTSSGRTAYPHEARVRPIRKVFWIGVEDGEDWTVEAWRRNTTWFNRIVERSDKRQGRA